MLVVTKEPFMKWVLDFARRFISNKYILMIEQNYATKWVETKALKTNMLLFISNKYILMIEQIMLPNGWRLRHSKPTCYYYSKISYTSIF
jgi:hypothetical protein